MAKTCPSCGYKPIGPFTDNCPICAEPVRNVRSEGAGGSGLGGGSMLRYGLVAGLLAVSGCCGLGMLQTGFGLWQFGGALQDQQKLIQEAIAKQEAERKARTVVVNAADMLKEFQDDVAAADQKYKGKYLEVSGIVERHGKNGGVPFVILHGGDADAPLRVECYDLFDMNDDMPAKQIEQGQAITVRGEFTGRVANPQMRGCTRVR